MNPLDTLEKYVMLLRLQIDEIEDEMINGNYDAHQRKILYDMLLHYCCVYKDFCGFFSRHIDKNIEIDYKVKHYLEK